MKRLHIFVALTSVVAVEAALSTLLGEPWTNAFRRDGGMNPDGSRVPSPYPGAAWSSGQWDDAEADGVAAAVLLASPTAAIGRGVVLGVEDDRVEMAPADVPGVRDVRDLTDPRESPARVYARWTTLNP